MSADVSSTSSSNVLAVIGPFKSKILSMLGSWKKGMEGKWNGMKEDWVTVLHLHLASCTMSCTSFILCLLPHSASTTTTTQCRFVRQVA